MDYQAIRMSSADDLQQLDCVKGDAMNLKHFAQSKLDEAQNVSLQKEKKRLLEDTLLEASHHRKKITTNNKKHKGKGRVQPKVNQTRKVSIGWLHYQESSRSYTQVKTAKGGGVCIVDLSLDSKQEKVVNIGKDLFFQNGSSIFGDIDDLEFGLANSAANK